MPLSRYQIRNEYSLADLELYKSADKDDPEALLEGVAMAGLVGVLRQLGDLAEFAAEVFHNLHEEVMATAARGHSLKARVQQLEVEFPLIENAFLSRTNHSAFFYNAGVDWHPNMHIDQNNITSGDLPRFLRDSHEEARGPPRLFLLDKFDVAGAGACLKRFTDPSFYKVEAITNPDVQRDKKVRKGKRRGSRCRNGETPEVLPTPHAKLHQLLLEERIENSASDPTRRVKLKRRLNGFPFDLKTGKSYMEKILRTPPPDYRELHEVYNSSPLKLLGDDFMPEFEKDDFGSESPDVELTRRSPSMSPDLKNGIQHVPMREMDFESDESYHYKPEFGRGEIGSKSPDLQLRHRSPSLTTEMRESKDFPKVKNSLEVGNIRSTLYDDPVEKQMIVDKESRSEGSTGFKSVDFTSDVENYMDALATTPLREAHFSDSQSIGSSTLSDDGNSSSKKYKSNSSYSGSPRILAQKSYLGDELSDVMDSSNEGETKSISRPLKWRGRTRNAGGSKITGIRPYSSIAAEPTFPNTDISSGFMVHRDVDSSVGENGVSQLKVVGMLSTEGVPGAEVSNVNESESNMSVNFPTDSTSSATHLQTGYDSIFRVFDENHLSNNGEDSHMLETSSCKAITSDETCFTEESTNQYMEEIVDKNILYMLQDVTPASCTLDGAPLNSEENLSSPKTQPLGELANHSPRMSEQPLKPSPQAMPENGLHEDLSNDESGSCEVLGDFYRASVLPSSYIEDIAEKEMSKPSLENMPQAGGGEDDFEGYPVVNQSDSQITIMPPAAEQTMELRFSELETSNRETDADSTDDNQVRIVSPPNSENFRIFGTTYILQPLDPVDSSTDNQIEEQFPDRSLSDTEDISDGAGHNVTLSGGSNMALADGEIAVEVEDTLSGIPKGSFSEDIQAPEVLDSVSQFDVETSDNGDENLHELPSLVVRVETGVTPAGENDPVKESLNVGPEVCALNEMQVSDPADDMLQLQATRIEISSEQLENLHELARLAEQKLEGVASSTDVGERSTTNGESIAGSINTSDTNVEGGRTQSNQNGVDTEVLFSVMYSESGTEEKGNMQKVASQSMDYYQTESRTLNNLSNSYTESNSSLHTDITASSTSEQSGSINTSDADVEGGRTQSNQYAVDTEVPFSVTYSESSAEEKGNIQKVASQRIDYDQTDSRILDKLSNSYPESESSLHTDITESSTSEQNRSHMNVIHAEKNTLDDYTMDALPMPMYCDAEDQKGNLPLHQLDEEETEVFRIRDESDMESNDRDPSVLEPSVSSSKWVDPDKTVSTNYTQDISPMSTRRDEEEQKVKLPLHQLEEEIIQVSTIAGESNVVLEPQLAQRINLDHLLGQEGISGIASISLSRNLPGQQSDSELLPQEKLAIDDVFQHNKPLGSIFPAFGLLSEPVNTDQLDMPPLPPLPPVQWRMGKNQQASLAHEKAVLPNNNILFPSISLDSNSHLLSLGELQSLNNLAAVTESHAPNQNLLLPGNNSKFNSVSETQSLYQDLQLPAKLDEMPQHDEHTCTSLSASSSQTNGDADASACDVELVAGSSFLVQFNNPEATSQTKLFHQGSASSETSARTHDASGLLTKIENERPHNMMFSPEGEVAWPTQEDGKPYGVRPMKLPRQRNPLIDAVIALDKSKLRKVTELSRTQIQKADERDSVLENLQLRKVTEQPRTQMQKADERDSLLENFQLRKVTEQPRLQIQETDERDSLLEQIRAKSFNLKPPVVSKPAVQGPTTNLKLAAILEKAKTIRQAFAGSDEDDDDDDSWSDS